MGGHHTKQSRGCLQKKHTQKVMVKRQNESFSNDVHKKKIPPRFSSSRDFFFQKEKIFGEQALNFFLGKSHPSKLSLSLSLSLQP